MPKPNRRVRCRGICRSVTGELFSNMAEVISSIRFVPSPKSDMRDVQCNSVADNSISIAGAEKLQASLKTNSNLQRLR